MNTKYHPFNGSKALVHTEYWKPIIEDGIVPPPRFISIDPCGVCDYRCPFCNAAEVMREHSSIMSIEIMNQIIDIIYKWNVRAICIGGGGESLLNENTSYLIDSLYKKCKIGVVTNGTHIPQHFKSLIKCKWVGISIDAGSSELYMKMKGISSDKWNMVMENIKMISNQEVEITWKYLLHPMNYNEVYPAIKKAKEIGCNVIHIRPGSNPWFIGGDSFDFTESMVNECITQIEQGIKDFEDASFKVFYVVEKFGKNWKVKKSFSKCYAVYTTCYIDSNGNIGLCCDRRGDPRIILGNIKHINELWGSPKHKDIQKKIQVEFCPRCTYTHVNEIFENVIIKDMMLYDMY